MGRPRKPENADLPPGVYRKAGVLYEIRDGKAVKAGPRSSDGMRGLIATFLAHKEKHVTANTAALYRSCARKLTEALAEFEPHQVKPRNVAEVKMQLAKTPAMANECVSFLRLVFDYALEHQLVESNPCFGVKRFESNKRTRCPTDSELRAIHDAAGPQLKVIIELLVLTGQRVGDVLRIKRSDIVDGGTAIRFKQQKTGAALTIKNPELRDVIARADALGGNVKAFTLLSNSRGKAPCYRQVIEEWHRVLRATGIEDLHMHDLRAKSITAAKRQGLDPRAVAGHASEAMTARYIREHDEPVVAGPSFAGVLRTEKQ
jgi:integrase